MQPAEELADAQLLAYLDESLAVDVMSHIEQRLRDSGELRSRLARLLAQRESGQHTIGDIWRRQRLTCLSRSQLGSYLLGALPAAERGYVEFHLTHVGCRCCTANLADLKQQSAEQPPQRTKRQKRFYETSVGRLKSK